MRLLTLFMVSSRISRILKDPERGGMLGTTPLLDRDIGSGHRRPLPGSFPKQEMWVGIGARGLLQSLI